MVHSFRAAWAEARRHGDVYFAASLPQDRIEHTHTTWAIGLIVSSRVCESGVPTPTSIFANIGRPILCPAGASDYSRSQVMPGD
jgi:hypothetical protein